MNKNILPRILILISSLFFCAMPSAQEGVPGSGTGQVAAAFNATNKPDQAIIIETKEKHEILFFMGVILLVMVFVTAGFGLAMALHGKQLFVPHMVSAGITVFLSLAHAVVAIVWFFPYK